MFDRMLGKTVLDHAGMLTQMDKQNKLGFATSGEAVALFSMYTVVPALFHDGTMPSAKDHNPSYFSRLKTFQDWSNGNVGLKQLIEEKLPQLESSIKTEIFRAFRTGSPAYAAAMACVNNTVSFIRTMISFVDDSTTHMTTHAKYTLAQAWSLVTQLTTRIFKELHLVRNGVTDELQTNNQAQICSLVLYTVFKTHDAMDKFTAANMKDHPAIASEYVKFLASNSGFELVETMQAEMKAMAVTVKQCAADVKAASKKGDTHGNQIDELKKSVSALNKALPKK